MPIIRHDVTSAFSDRKALIAFGIGIIAAAIMALAWGNPFIRITMTAVAFGCGAYLITAALIHFIALLRKVK